MVLDKRVHVPPVSGVPTYRRRPRAAQYLGTKLHTESPSAQPSYNLPSSNPAATILVFLVRPTFLRGFLVRQYVQRKVSSAPDCARAVVQGMCPDRLKHDGHSSQAAALPGGIGVSSHQGDRKCDAHDPTRAGRSRRRAPGTVTKERSHPAHGVRFFAPVESGQAVSFVVDLQHLIAGFNTVASKLEQDGSFLLYRIQPRPLLGRPSSLIVNLFGSISRVNFQNVKLHLFPNVVPTQTYLWGFTKPAK